MTVGRFEVPPVPDSLRAYAWRIALPIGCVLLSAEVGRSVGSPWLLRLSLAAALLAVIVAIATTAPRPLLLGVIVWVALLGLTRRWLTGLTAPGGMDPLLVVGPASLVILGTVSVRAALARRDSALSRAVLVLTVLIFLGAFNPQQGNLAAGLTGLLFFAQLLAFWIGRGICDDRTLRRVLLLVAGLALPTCAYGMYQVFSGFPSWDRAWINTVGFNSLDVGGAIRPFSTFSSAAEYATFLAAAALIWLTLGPKRLLTPVTVAAIGFIVTGVVYQSSRGTIVMLVISAGLVAGAWRRLPLVAAVGLGVLFLFVLPRIVGHVAPSSYGSSPSAALLSHQVQGLANPLDPSKSTAAIHLSLAVDGIKAGFKNPLGLGIGTITLAAKKFGGIAASSETDPSNAAIALGLPGLAAFLAVLGIGFARTYRLATKRRDGLSLAALAIITVTVLQWLNGGQYSVAFLPWLLLGWVDASAVDRKAARAAERAREAAP